VAVVLALAALAAYTVFSGPTTVPAPPGGLEAAPRKPAPAKSAGEEGIEEREGSGGR